MVTFNPLTGQGKVSITRREMEMWLEHWRQKPETRAMFEKIAAQRRARVDKILADIRKTCQKSREA